MKKSGAWCLLNGLILGVTYKIVSHPPSPGALQQAWIWILANASERRNETDNGRSICTDKRYLDRCLSKLPKFVDQSLMRRMPVSKLEIDALCRAFEMGMKCMSRYSSKCLDKLGKQFLESQVSGARKVFNALCHDESFRAEYLRHSICLKGTQKNWESCVTRFTELVKEEIYNKNYSREGKMFQTCCAIHGFSRCIYLPGRLKCDKEAAVFLLKLADMSIDHSDYLWDCRSFTNYKICSGSSKALPQIILLIFYVFLQFLQGLL